METLPIYTSNVDVINNLGTIVPIALENLRNLCEGFSSDLTLNLQEEESTQIRRIVSRILICANAVAAGGRFGPANVIYMSPDYQVKLYDRFMSNDIGGMRIISVPTMGDTILVGRVFDIESAETYEWYKNQTELHKEGPLVEASKQFCAFQIIDPNGN